MADVEKSYPSGAILNTPKVSSAHTLGLSQNKNKKTFSYVALFGSELAGAFFMFSVLMSLAAIVRLSPAGYEILGGTTGQALAGGAAVFAITAALSGISAVFSFSSSIAGALFIGIGQPRHWPRAYVHWAWYNKLGKPRRENVMSWGWVALKCLIEITAQLGAAILAGALVLGLMPASVPTAQHLCGQPSVNPGTTNAEALLAEAFGGTLVKWVALIAFGAPAVRISDHVGRAAMIGGAFVGARAITSLFIESSFNFWTWFGAAIFAGFKANWWIFLVGEVISTVVALGAYYLLHREVETEENSTMKSQ